MSPDAAAELAKATAEIYADATVTVLNTVARRLAAGIDRPGWAEAKTVELAALRDAARRVVDQLNTLAPEAVEAALREALSRGARAAVDDLQGAGMTADLVRTAVPAVDALARETVGQVRSTHPRILRVAEDIYRTVVAEATAQVSAGAATRRQAAQRALDRFAMQGVTGFVDAAGRGWDLASYAEMSVRTASGRAAVDGYVGQLVAHDVTLGFISSSPAPCSLCDPWEGRIVTVAGADPRYPTLDEARSSGLFHANCTHAVEGYIPGVSDTGRDDRPPKNVREQRDADRAEQRRLERGVRQWKQREAVALDEDARRQARSKVREWQARARRHAEATSAKRLPYRESITRAR